MSWQPYVDKLVAGGKNDKAAILSVSGDSVWAYTQGFAAKPEEIKAIVAGFNSPNALMESGIYLDSVKYIYVKPDEDKPIIYGRKGKEGICCVKTRQALLITHHPDGVQAADCITSVDTLGKDLTDVGY